MPKRESNRTGSELFIVDNSADDWKALLYLNDWCQLSKSIDVATGYFEIGALLALGDEWRKVDHIRILMGDEVSKRTKRAFETGLREIVARLDASIEGEKEKNHFLKGVEAIVEGIRNGRIVNAGEKLGGGAAQNWATLGLGMTRATRRRPVSRAPQIAGG